MNRRVAFFALAAVVCFLLIPLLDEKYKWVPKALGALYVVLALATAAELFGRRKL